LHALQAAWILALRASIYLRLTALIKFNRT
jgi:hypothetical protein